jgi:acyl-CoA synthetase (NDP forming)
MTAEACEKEGLTIGTLEPSTIIKLDKYLPSRWPRRNPVDMAGPSAAEFSVIADLLWALIEDKNLDFIFLLAPIVMDRALLASRMGLSPEAIKAYRAKEEKNMMLIREKVEKYEKPVVTMWQMRGLSNAPDTAPLLHKAKVLVCANARRAARVLRYLVWYRQYLDATTGK